MALLLLQLALLLLQLFWSPETGRALLQTDDPPTDLYVAGVSTHGSEPPSAGIGTAAFLLKSELLAGWFTTDTLLLLLLMEDSASGGTLGLVGGGDADGCWHRPGCVMMPLDSCC